VQEVYILDLIGTFSFAVYGGYYAQTKNFNLFGVFSSAFLSALGGGTIRELILNNTPFYFYDMNYIFTIIAGVIFIIFVYKIFREIHTVALIFDSIGLVAFAFIGAAKAESLGMNMFAIIFFATITAIGGGVLRDIVFSEVPKIMYRDCCAMIAIFIGVLYGVFSTYMQYFFWSNLLMILFFFIRLMVIAYDVRLWVPQKKIGVNDKINKNILD
jgi:uncharacterized membrane protein YeiH